MGMASGILPFYSFLVIWLFKNTMLFYCFHPAKNTGFDFGYIPIFSRLLSLGCLYYGFGSHTALLFALTHFWRPVLCNHCPYSLGSLPFPKYDLSTIPEGLGGVSFPRL